jgi:hypothetical protein
MNKKRFLYLVCGTFVLLFLYFRPFEYHLYIVNEKDVPIFNVLADFALSHQYILGTLAPKQTKAVMPSNFGETVPYIEFKDEKGVVRQALTGGYRTGTGNGGLVFAYIKNDNTVWFVDWGDDGEVHQAQVLELSPTRLQKNIRQ